MIYINVCGTRDYPRLMQDSVFSRIIAQNFIQQVVQTNGKVTGTLLTRVKPEFIWIRRSILGLSNSFGSRSGLQIWQADWR